MKDVTFYRDCGEDEDGASLKQKFIYRSRKAGIKPTQNVELGNVVAIWNQEGFWSGPHYVFGGEAAIMSHANSAVGSSSVGYFYLMENCIRVSEAVARQIHPAMFEALDRMNATESDNAWRECAKHGEYRGYDCPSCEDQPGYDETEQERRAEQRNEAILAHGHERPEAPESFRW